MLSSKTTPRDPKCCDAKQSQAKRMIVAEEGERLEGCAPAMAANPSASSSSSPLDSTVHRLEVACAELNSLHETRSVYEKHGAIFFRTTVKAAAKSQQKELEKAKASARKAAQ